VIERVLPPEVAAAEAFDDPAGVVLFPAEEAALGRAGDQRRREFTTARMCARIALGRLGIAPAPIVPGTRGAPGWPAGVVGSMTHCAGYRAAAVARIPRVRTIGLDAEPAEELPPGVLDEIATAAERAQLHELSATVPVVPWGRLLFSAKESLYKAWFPLTLRWLDFADASVVLAPDGGFVARVLVPPVDGREPTTFRGRWLAADGLVLTAIVLRAPAAPLTC
jgi:4'-phosphopantetheinyl transferase EntD